YLAALDSSENHQLLTRLIVWPALGSETERNTWRTGVENGLARILQLEVVGPDTLPPLAGNHLFFHDYCQAYAVTCYEHARYLQSVSAITGMLDQAAELDLSDEEIFVWSLRLRQLQEQQAATKPRTDEPIWPEMFELGSFDSRSAWAIWVAQRRQRQLPAIPTETGSDELACWLGGLGEAWVLDQEIEDAGFSREARAGLGAATLAKGPQLTAFFKSYSTPPASYTFQRFWVHGQRRAAGYSPDTTEAMARLTGLRPSIAADLWRRASEAYCLRGDWSRGLDALDRAAALLPQIEGSQLAKQIGAWMIQAAVQAKALEKPAELARILALADTVLRDDLLERFDLEAGALGFRPARPVIGGEDRVDLARAKVLAGKAADLRLLATPDLQAKSRRLRQQLLTLWVNWGVGLLTAETSPDSLPTLARHYVKGLQAIQQATDPRTRLDVAGQTVGGYLGRQSFGPALERWLVGRDIARLSRLGRESRPSPIGELARAQDNNSRDGHLALHVLLGVALLAGDDSGLVTTAIRLPLGGLSRHERRRFLYPVPQAEALLAQLATVELEPALVLAIARNESLFEPAVRSRAGALGWLQIMPFNLEDRGLAADGPCWRDPILSFGVGSSMLLHNAKQYRNDPYRTLAAYNGGPEAVARWIRQLGGSTDRALFRAWIGYTETRAYVEKVLIDREIYDWILSECDGEKRPKPGPGENK
ncbi:MAG: transglycosylase SLT domain-containing protein, partial [bacterium]